MFENIISAEIPSKVTFIRDLKPSQSFENQEFVNLLVSQNNNSNI